MASNAPQGNDGKGVKKDPGLRKLVKRLSEYKLELFDQEQEPAKPLSAKELFEKEFSVLETKVYDVKKWVETTTEELQKTTTPSTFDEILDMIAPMRIRTVKQLQKQIKTLRQERNRLTEKQLSMVHEHFSDRVWNIVKTEKECEKRLKVIEKKATANITTAALEFKKNLSKFVKEYREGSKTVRTLLQSTQEKAIRKLPPITTLSAAKASLDEAIKAKQPIMDIKEKVGNLTKMGGFIGKFNNPRAQEVKFDAQDLQILNDNCHEKLQKRIETLTAIYDEELKKDSLAKMEKIDEGHKDKYIRLMEWTDQQVGMVSEFPKQRQPERLETYIEKLKALVELGIGGQQEVIRNELAPISTNLVASEYKWSMVVQEREKKAYEALLQLKLRAELEMKRANRIVMAFRIKEFVVAGFSLKLEDSTCTLISEMADLGDVKEDPVESGEGAESEAETLSSSDNYTVGRKATMVEHTREVSQSAESSPSPERKEITRESRGSIREIPREAGAQPSAPTPPSLSVTSTMHSSHSVIHLDENKSEPSNLSPHKRPSRKALSVLPKLQTSTPKYIGLLGRSMTPSTPAYNSQLGLPTLKSRESFRSRVMDLENVIVHYEAEVKRLTDENQRLRKENQRLRGNRGQGPTGKGVQSPPLSWV